MARVVAAEAGFAERAQQIAQRLEAQKIEALVGDFEADFALHVADLAHHFATSASGSGCSVE